MFKFLSSRDEDPGFQDAVILTNKSQHWLTLTEEGHRLPPHSHAAIDAVSASLSKMIPLHVDGGLLIISRGGPEPTRVSKVKRKRKGEDSPVAEPSPNTDAQQSTNLVAEPELENWVSSNESIVGLPTTDEI